MSLKNLLQERGVILDGSSEAGKKINDFSSKSISEKVFKLCNENQSIRFIFNYLIKSGNYGESTDLETIINEIFERLRRKDLINESFLRSAKCHCGKEIKKCFWENDEVQCPHCGYSLRDWKTEFNVDKIHIQKLLGYLESKKLIDFHITARCNFCSNIKNIEPNKNGSQKEFFCEDCGKFMKVDYFYGFPSRTISDLTSQGYWLEWYVKKLLENEFPSAEVENSKLFTKEESKNKKEIDVLMKLATDEIVAISCYDTHKKADSSKVNGILKFNSFADLIIFLTSGTINESNCEHIIENTKVPVILINGKQIEDIGTLIRERLTKNLADHIKNEEIDKVSTYLYLYKYSYPEEEKQKLIRRVIEVAKEIGFMKSLNVLSKINYDKNSYFPIKVIMSYDITDEIEEDIDTLFDSMNSQRWEKIILSAYSICRIFDKLKDKQKLKYISNLFELSSHRSVYVRNEIPSIVKNIYPNVRDNEKTKLMNLLDEMTADGAYPSARAAKIFQELKEIEK